VPADTPDGMYEGAIRLSAQSALPYDNGSVFDALDWTWRPESGDWRFFYYDVPSARDGTKFLADTTWDDKAPFTDLDTVILGRSANTTTLGGATVTPSSASPSAAPRPRR
jgi:hypothetical protein